MPPLVSLTQNNISPEITELLSNLNFRLYQHVDRMEPSYNMKLECSIDISAIDLHTLSANETKDMIDSKLIEVKNELEVIINNLRTKIYENSTSQ